MSLYKLLFPSVILRRKHGKHLRHLALLFGEISRLSLFKRLLSGDTGGSAVLYRGSMVNTFAPLQGLTSGGRTRNSGDGCCNRVKLRTDVGMLSFYLLA